MLTLYDEFLHFLDKCGIRLGEAGALVSTQRRAGVKEVDSEVSVVPFYRLADVLIRTKKKLQCYPIHKYMPIGSGELKSTNTEKK